MLSPGFCAPLATASSLPPARRQRSGCARALRARRATAWLIVSGIALLTAVGCAARKGQSDAPTNQAAQPAQRELSPADFVRPTRSSQASAEKHAAESSPQAAAPSLSATQPAALADALPASSSAASSAPLLASPSPASPPATQPLSVNAVEEPLPPASASAATAPSASPPSPTDETQAPPAYAVAGMVGQVNGKAIYAQTVFDPIEEQLQALGGQLPEEAFRQRAAELILGRLDEIVSNALLLGQAQRDLTKQEQMALRQILQDKRQELIRRHGRGSLAVAEAQLLADTGKTLDQTLEEYRQTILISRYLSRKLMPRIHVTRSDIQRYYRDHFDEYNPPAQRVIRLIRVADAQQAQQVQQRLEAGEPFADVAADPINQFRPSEGGRMEVTGDQPLAFEPLNRAVAQLLEGQSAGPIQTPGQPEAFWFILVEQLDRPPGQPLEQVQRQIEETLRRQQFEALSRQYQQRLYAEGSYTPREQMAQTLLQIAMSRYAAAQQSP